MTEAPGTSAPTVDEIRRFALPAGTELVGGVTGLARPVFWVRVAQLEQSSLGRIESGDLVLLAGPAAGRPGRHSALANLLSRLAELGAAGVVTMTGVPPGAGVIANAIGIPLLKLPSGSRLHDIEKRTIALIINRQAEIEQRGVQIYRELAQQAIDNLGIEAIAEKLVELTGKLVAVEDSSLSLQLLAVPPSSTVTREELQVSLRDSADPREWFAGQSMVITSPPVTLRHLNAPGWARYVAPVVVRDKVDSYLSLIGPLQELDEIDQIATGRGAAVCAIEMAKSLAISEAESRISSDFVDDLISGSITSDAVIVGRAQLMGYDLTEPHVVAVIELDASENDLDSSPTGDGDDIQTPRQEFARRLSGAMSREQPQAMLRVNGNTGILIWPVPAGGSISHVKPALDRLRLEISQAMSAVTVSAAVGRMYPRPNELRQSFREAEQALSIALRLYGGNRTTDFEELGIHRLLFHLQGTAELESFYQETLAQLTEYDREHGGELVDTLRTFFANHGNLSRTADQLILHRNTVSYRLERIAQLTGLDLDDEGDRFRLHLALKLIDLVRPGRSADAKSLQALELPSDREG